MIGTGRHYHAIPGPSVVPDRVLNAMHRAAPDIYAGELHDMVPSLYEDLKRLARTRHHVAIYIANGHGAWEAANTNLFSPGDRALSLVTGRFGEGWAQWAEALDVSVRRLDFGRQSAVDPDQVAKALGEDRDGRIRVVLMTHVDTASSVRNDVAAVRAAIDRAGHPALLAVDCIASLGCDTFEMDLWGADVVVSASQKGIMTPPGLGFVWLSEKARQASARSRWRTPYWDWTPRMEAGQFYRRFGGTAPTHHLFGLREALDMLVHEEGVEAAWARHARLARSVWSAFEAWGEGDGKASGIGLNVADPASRAHSVTTVRLAAPGAARLREWTRENAGVTLGIGLGMVPEGDPAGDGYMRVAHMGHVNAHMTLGVLGAIEAGMKALAIPHGAGALSRAAAELA